MTREIVKKYKGKKVRVKILKQGQCKNGWVEETMGNKVGRYTEATINWVTDIFINLDFKGEHENYAYGYNDIDIKPLEYKSHFPKWL